MKDGGEEQNGDPRHVLGKRAEEAAANYLLEAGFALIGRNVRVGRLELDLLVRAGEVVVVVEVRSRGESAWVRAIDSVDRKKQARVRRAGESLWRTRFKKDLSIQRMRFDVISVSFGEDGQAQVEHVKAAF